MPRNRKRNFMHDATYPRRSLLCRRTYAGGDVKGGSFPGAWGIRQLFAHIDDEGRLLWEAQ